RAANVRGKRLRSAIGPCARRSGTGWERTPGSPRPYLLTNHNTMTPRMAARNTPLTILTSTFTWCREGITGPREPPRKSMPQQARRQKSQRAVERGICRIIRALEGHGDPRMHRVRKCAGREPNIRAWALNLPEARLNFRPDRARRVVL